MSSSLYECNFFGFAVARLGVKRNILVKKKQIKKKLPLDILQYWYLYQRVKTLSKNRKYRYIHYAYI